MFVIFYSNNSAFTRVSKMEECSNDRYLTISRKEGNHPSGALLAPRRTRVAAAVDLGRHQPVVGESQVTSIRDIILINYPLKLSLPAVFSQVPPSPSFRVEQVRSGAEEVVTSLIFGSRVHGPRAEKRGGTRLETSGWFPSLHDMVRYLSLEHSSNLTITLQSGNHPSGALCCANRSGGSARGQIHLPRLPG